MNVTAEWAAVIIAALAALASFSNIYMSSKINQRFTELRLEIAKGEVKMMEWARTHFIEKGSFLETVQIAVHKIVGDNK